MKGDYKLDRFTIKVPCYTRLDALVEQRNKFLSKQVEFEVNLRINQAAINNLHDEGEDSMDDLNMTFNEINGLMIGAESFGRSIEIIDGMIKEELAAMKKFEEDRRNAG